ncbi:MAG: hypothetical protein P8Y67_13810, partial [Alphaproteobacteria bacterium]
RDAAARFNLSARGYHRTLRLARTLADLAGDDRIATPHIAEALSFRGEGISETGQGALAPQTAPRSAAAAGSADASPQPAYARLVHNKVNG